MLCGDLNGKEIQKRRGICIRIMNSFCHTAETNIRLKSNYTPIKIFLNLLGTFISEQLHGVIFTMLPVRKLKHRNSLTGQPVWASRQTDGQTDRATERVDIPSGKFP